MRRISRLLALAALVVALAGCGSNERKATTTTPAAQFTVVRVYFLVHGKLQPVSRFVSTTQPAWLGAWKDLAVGPTGEEPLAASTALPFPETSGWTLGLTNENIISLSTVTLPRTALAQATYTLTQFAPKRPVIVNGRRYRRADFEDLTPAILVESPLPDQSVTRPLRVTGTANTFEATFEYELVDSAGEILTKHFVTATSGSGTRGTYDITVAYAAGHGGPGKLVVYESSAKDGSRIHVVKIPLRLAG